jgi:hypothetical protein
MSRWEWVRLGDAINKQGGFRGYQDHVGSHLGPWLLDEFDKFKRRGSLWNVEEIYPAHFANSSFFDGEFELRLQIEKRCACLQGMMCGADG